MERTISRQGWIILLGVPALFVSAFVIGTSPKLMGLPLCSVRSFLHLDCPGCGLTRSIAVLTHGEMARSIAFHPLGIVIASWLVFLFLKETAGIAAGRRLATPISQRGRDIMLAGFVAALFAQWLVKLYFLLFTSNF